MFTMTDMIEINQIYRDTLRVQGLEKANEYFQKTKKYILGKYNLTEDLYRSLWNGANRINNR